MKNLWLLSFLCLLSAFSVSAQELSCRGAGQQRQNTRNQQTGFHDFATGDYRVYQHP